MTERETISSWIWTLIDDNDKSTYPEEGTFVLANFADGRIGVCSFYSGRSYGSISSSYWKNFWTDESYAIDYSWWQNRVIAWMPLPDGLRLRDDT